MEGRSTRHGKQGEYKPSVDYFSEAWFGSHTTVHRREGRSGKCFKGNDAQDFFAPEASNRCQRAFLFTLPRCDVLNYSIQ